MSSEVDFTNLDPRQWCWECQRMGYVALDFNPDGEILATCLNCARRFVLKVRTIGEAVDG